VSGFLPSGAETVHSYPDLKALIQSEFGLPEKLYITPHLNEAGLNPYLTRLYGPFEGTHNSLLRPLASIDFLVPFFRRVLHGEKSVWHQHWLQFSGFPTWFRTQFRLTASALYVLAGGRILWTIHNARPHVEKYVRLNLWYCKMLARLSSRFHVHNLETVQVVMDLFAVPASRICVLAHPHFETSPIPNAQARTGLGKRYGLDAEGRKLFLMFGVIAGYKGIREVVEIFRRIDPRKGLLIIAGPPRGNEPEYARSLRSNGLPPSVALLDRMIPEADVNLFLCGADWAIYNHARSLNSSAMQLAFDYGCPILTPNLEAASVFEGKTVVKFHSLQELEKLILERLEH
jgi:beta-1,4-mannosyltransferase